MKESEIAAGQCWVSGRKQRVIRRIYFDKSEYLAGLMIDFIILTVDNKYRLLRSRKMSNFIKWISKNKAENEER